MSNSLKERYETSALFGSNAPAVEALYEQYQENPDSVSASWRQYFRQLAEGDQGNGQATRETSHLLIRQRLIECLPQQVHQLGFVVTHGIPLLRAARNQRALSF